MALVAGFGVDLGARCVGLVGWVNPVTHMEKRNAATAIDVFMDLFLCVCVDKFDDSESLNENKRNSQRLSQTHRLGG